MVSHTVVRNTFDLSSNTLLHLRKYLIICKSKEKSSKQILAPVLVEIDNTCRQRFSVKLCQKTSCLLQFAICFTISTGLFVVVYFRILRLSYYAQIFFTYPLKIEFQSV